MQLPSCPWSYTGGNFERRSTDEGRDDVDGNGNIDSQDYGLAYSNSIVGANIINPFSYQKKK